MVYYCNVEMYDLSQKWVQVNAHGFEEAIIEVLKFECVKRVFEISLVPGGTVT